MKNLTMLSFTALLFSCGPSDSQQDGISAEKTQYAPDQLVGAWETTIEPDTGGVFTGVTIISDGYLSYMVFNEDQKTFHSTVGGAWTLEDDKLNLIYEYHTSDAEYVGDTVSYTFTQSGDTLSVENGMIWTRIDGGTPGKLAGAWLITGRQRDGEMSRMEPGVRKTMKILSGTRFQWIAYNTETAEFFGTGGGTYTTGDSTYTENIDFFSRDSSRVGATLEFEYQLEDGEWHHSGLSSKGDPIYEIWTPRAKLDENLAGVE